MATSLAGTFNQVQLLLVRYELPFILVLGTLGNLLNIMVFCRRALRTNVCSWYFICLSVTHLLQLLIICIIQIVTIHSGFDLAGQSMVFCKIRQYAFDLIMILSRHFLCLISIDRWMVTSSNAWLRQLSSAHIARWVIVISIIFWTVFGIHSAIGFTNTFFICIPPPSSNYQLFYSVYSMIISVVPMALMIIFSVLTLRNVRGRKVHRISPTQPTGPSTNHSSTPIVQSMSSNQQKSQRDTQLIRLSILQVLVYLLLNSVWAMSPMYAFVTTIRGNRTLEERLWTGFLVGFGFNLIFTYTALTFPIYTLVSPRFRQEFIAMMKDIGKVIQRSFHATV